MTTTGVQFRLSSYMNAVNIGMAYPREFAFTEGNPAKGHDLTQYSSITLIVYDSANSKVDDFTCTVLADTVEGPDGTDVQNACSVLVEPTGTAGDYFYHFVGALGGKFYQLGKPAKIGYYAAPPTS